MRRDNHLCQWSHPRPPCAGLAFLSTYAGGSVLMHRGTTALPVASAFVIAASALFLVCCPLV
jgi:hypothetical protein